MRNAVIVFVDTKTQQNATRSLNTFVISQQPAISNRNHFTKYANFPFIELLLRFDSRICLQYDSSFQREIFDFNFKYRNQNKHIHILKYVLHLK